MKYNYFIKWILLSVILIIILNSCEKEITLDLPRPASTYVIEGYIEQGQTPYVLITKNAGYFDPVDTATLLNMLVLDANVSVTCEDTTEVLELIPDFNIFPFVKYAGSSMIGKAGKTYSLLVKINGKEYTSITTIPNPTPLDSIVFKPDKKYDTLGLIWFYFKDPDTIGNCYRLYTMNLGEDPIFVHMYPSVYNDQLFNGQYVEYTVYKGENPNIAQPENQPKDEFRWYFKKGSTVIFKLCSIDQATYNFWYSVEMQMGSAGNPFASPINVKSNIKGGALGVWGGFAVSLDTLFIK